MKNQRKPSAHNYPGAKIVGLISDTHGLLREEAIAALRGVDVILHAGDVGKPEILAALEALAPVVAVRGNVDTAAWAQALPETAPVQAGDANLYMLHNEQELGLNPAIAGFHIMICGHTHRPSRSERDGVLYLNPGSAGPRRFHLPVSVARLHVDVAHWNVEWIDLTQR